jgi:hypothetical protein
MNAAVEPVDPETGSLSAVKAAETALELNRARLSKEVAEAQVAGHSPFRHRGLLGVVVSEVIGRDLREALAPYAERHPYGVIAASAAVGGIAYFAIPRIAVGLVVPVLMSGGRRFAGAWLRGRLHSAVRNAAS